MKRIALALMIPLLLLLGIMSWLIGWWGQTLPGRHVDYYKVYDGGWEVACDTATDGSDTGCYIQYVDVYRPRPEFAAAMVELVMRDGPDGTPDPHLRFDIEPGLSFREATVSVALGEGAETLDMSHCAVNTCLFSGQESHDILNVMRRGTALHLEIDEGRGDPARLVWPLWNIETILDDFAAQRAKRGLP